VLWIVGWVGGEERRVLEEGDSWCLALEWVTAPQGLPSGLYWRPHTCDMVGGYVCKKHNQGTSLLRSLNLLLSIKLLLDNILLLVLVLCSNNRDRWHLVEHIHNNISTLGGSLGNAPQKWIVSPFSRVRFVL
jgi:hypothetical protein